MLPACRWPWPRAVAVVVVAAALVVGAVCGGLLLVRYMSASHTLASTAMRLVVDTDAGTDDAMALFMILGYAARRPDHVVVTAVTCVHGNTALANVVVNVLKVLQTAGRLDVPVFAGASESLLVTPLSDDYFGKDGFGDVEYRDPPDPAAYVSRTHAANALVDLVNKYPGEITLLCLGPLTNVALAIKLDPEFLAKVKHVVILGGSAEGIGNIKPGVEFNFCMDPEADFVVLNSTDTSSKEILPVELVPWETVSEYMNITLEWRVETLGAVDSAAMRLLNAAERKQMAAEPSSQWSTADPVAAAVLLFPHVVLSSNLYHASVETQGADKRGALLVDYAGTSGSPANVRLVQRVDEQALKAILLENLS